GRPPVHPCPATGRAVPAAVWPPGRPAATVSAARPPPGLAAPPVPPPPLGAGALSCAQQRSCFQRGTRMGRPAVVTLPKGLRTTRGCCPDRKGRWPPDGRPAAGQGGRETQLVMLQLSM